MVLIHRAYATHLKALRRLAGWTQVELGNRAGINPVMISQMETYRVTMPFGMAVKLANAFGVPLDVLCGRTPPKGPCSTISLEVVEMITRQIIEDLEAAKKKDPPATRSRLTQAEADAMAAEMEYSG